MTKILRFILLTLVLFVGFSLFLPAPVSAQACMKCPIGYDKFWGCPIRVGDIAEDEVCCKRSGIVWPFISYEYAPEVSCMAANAVANGPCGSVTNPRCETAIGRVNANPSGIITVVFRLVLSISGVLAVFLIIMSGYKLTSSRGNPEQVQQAREQFTSAIIGLLFLVFSLVILQLIGTDILGLCYFGFCGS